MRDERDKLKAALQRALGQQLDQLAATDLVTRIDELTRQNHDLALQLARVREDNAKLERQLTEAEDDLAAARTSLRRMIREENQGEEL